AHDDAAISRGAIRPARKVHAGVVTELDGRRGPRENSGTDGAHQLAWRHTVSTIRQDLETGRRGLNGNLPERLRGRNEIRGQAVAVDDIGRTEHDNLCRRTSVRPGFESPSMTLVIDLQARHR